MALFESTLALLLGAVILTGVARRVGRLEEEVDWAELDAAPAGSFQPLLTDGEPAGPPSR